ncbi:4Fe-4S dicluster domain-containing protein [Cytobacillus sp. Hz8]|uniref:4Fe-4S dicluster domain-containing protein n=1 Tax=Cytobacillus sp. Hz8 TaxID=3347168 RepID=UPI0035D59E0C
MGLFEKWVESLDYEYEILQKCTRQKSPRSTCSNCVEVCQRNAISIKNGIPILNAAKCNECGKCIAACPVQAVAGIFPQRMIIQNQLVAFKTEEAPEVKELLIFYKKGVKTIITEDNELDGNWEEKIYEVNRILEVLGEPLISVSFQEIQQEEKKYTRKELLTAWRKEGQSLMKQMVPAKWRFNQNDLDLAKYYPNYQFAQISLDADQCTLCGACQKLCDKNCFTITDSSFMISAQKCSACRLCQDTCPEKAIVIEEKVMPNTPIDIPKLHKTCTSCHKQFETLSDANDECIPCVKRKGFMIAH